MSYQSYKTFTTRCVACGRTTSKAHARTHNGVCAACASGVAPVVERAASEFKQRHGRCEDAPCCGCCGPQGDGDYYGYAAMEASYEPRD